MILHYLVAFFGLLFFNKYTAYTTTIKTKYVKYINVIEVLGVKICNRNFIIIEIARENNITPSQIIEFVVPIIDVFFLSISFSVLI